VRIVTEKNIPVRILAKLDKVISAYDTCAGATGQLTRCINSSVRGVLPTGTALFNREEIATQSFASFRMITCRTFFKFPCYFSKGRRIEPQFVCRLPSHLDWEKVPLLVRRNWVRLSR
jgi:hypothetical protein